MREGRLSLMDLILELKRHSISHVMTLTYASRIKCLKMSRNSFTINKYQHYKREKNKNCTTHDRSQWRHVKHLVFFIFRVNFIVSFLCCRTTTTHRSHSFYWHTVLHFLCRFITTNDLLTHPVHDTTKSTEITAQQFWTSNQVQMKTSIKNVANWPSY